MLAPPYWLKDIVAIAPNHLEDGKLSKEFVKSVKGPSRLGDWMAEEMRSRLGKKQFVFTANLRGEVIVFEDKGRKPGTIEDLKALQDAQGGGPVLIQAFAVDDNIFAECNDRIRNLLRLDKYARQVNKARDETFSALKDEIPRISTFCTKLYRAFNPCSSVSITIGDSDIESAHKWLAGFTDFLDRVTGNDKVILTRKDEVLPSYASADTRETLKMYVCAEETMAQIRRDYPHPFCEAAALLLWLKVGERDLPDPARKRVCQ
jgi:hypothetical protein